MTGGLINLRVWTQKHTCTLSCEDKGRLWWYKRLSANHKVPGEGRSSFSWFPGVNPDHTLSWTFSLQDHESVFLLLVSPSSCFLATAVYQTNQSLSLGLNFCSVLKILGGRCTPLIQVANLWVWGQPIYRGSSMTTRDIQSNSVSNK